jgi:aminopeptidase N
MTVESTVISDIQPDEWIIFNVQQVGYYKVDYSRDLWTTIIDAYKRSPESIPKVNREVLHAEMFDGWMTLGTKSISDCLELLGVLEVEREGAVWEQAGQYIEELNKFFLFSEFYDNFLTLMHAQLAPHVDSLEKDDKRASILKEQVTRWSKETQHESYLRLELDKLVNYMNTGDETKRPDFCSGFRIANASVYNHFFDKVFSEEILFDFELVSSLGCRQDAIKLESLLANMLDSKKINDFLVMETFSSTMRNSLLGLETVMDFSYRRMKDIMKM